MHADILRSFLIISFCSILCLELSAQRIVCDDNCKLDDAAPMTAPSSLPGSALPRRRGPVSLLSIWGFLP